MLKSSKRHGSLFISGDKLSNSKLTVAVVIHQGACGHMLYSNIIYVYTILVISGAYQQKLSHSESTVANHDQLV